MEIVYTLVDIDLVAQRLLAYLTERVIVFRGEMGAGKTTLIKALVKAMGSSDTVSSPTFALVNPYMSEEGTIYHFDFYRIKKEEEAFDIGFEEYLYSGDWCFIEWAERVPSYLPEKYIAIDIEVIDANTRRLKVKLF
ncbi:tRNA threonylcarbamoyladenosine biosynthesis protein TsaE [Capnocytophaga haemolytica]|jgi:hydrolase, P-loop family|uniref:tRNA threonylcarbamoyladenosine biosynthesis protein TsaE n=1 Tax=Capnocytophaga haemolytica TaxID=45243 RepID=A0AAX2GXB6_9FLAO|nr:tRNA (adenosine(37)-N6)-threonylcarbamoyltransferase complex ATPase subunit type 1 TsaE [Capnocytophaga haemolytica]AMD84900.1 tRNA threonylcarbamoyladenosine biosynthesis protein TsaE [Capnocytophaga haemolytica]SFN77802.1 tRNA threonylcarbamoyladenosine biosynthesis protein TsaE [Capnocytophaga haemolytica]SNV06542.1 ADP-binding protein [Capnocytophaga haemolytica]